MVTEWSIAFKQQGEKIYFYQNLRRIYGRNKAGVNNLKKVNKAINLRNKSRQNSTFILNITVRKNS